MKIKLNNYPIDLIIGHYSHEQKTKSRILLSFDIQLKQIKNNFSDKLEDTLDYENFLKEVNLYVEKTLSKLYLLEFLLNKLGQHLIIKYKKIKNMTINAEKISIPSCSWSRGANVILEQSFYCETIE